MVVKRFYPPALAWNFVSFGLMWFLIGSAISLARAKDYQIEVAEYKLQVGTALSQVKKASNKLEEASNSPTIAPIDRIEIRAVTQESDRIIKAVEKDIDSTIEKLSKPEAEK